MFLLKKQSWKILENLHLDSFFGKLFQSFYKWSVESSSSSELKEADVIIVLSFGGRPAGPGKINVSLAKIAGDLSKRYNLPMIAQWEVADSSLELQDRLLHVVREAKGPKPGVFIKLIEKLTTKKTNNKASRYLDSYEVLTQAAEASRMRGLKKAIIVAHSDHAWRAGKVAEKLGFQVLFPYSKVTDFDKKSIQKYTRKRRLWRTRELLARLYYLFTGKM